MTRSLDLSRPVLIAVALLLAVMIVLPVGWLVIYSLSDKEGAATLGNFTTLFTDPSFVDPLITTLIIAVSVSTICCLVAARVPRCRRVKASLSRSTFAPPGATISICLATATSWT